MPKPGDWLADLRHNPEGEDSSAAAFRYSPVALPDPERRSVMEKISTLEQAEARQRGTTASLGSPAAAMAARPAAAEGTAGPAGAADAPPTPPQQPASLSPADAPSWRLGDSGSGTAGGTHRTASAASLDAAAALPALSKLLTAEPTSLQQPSSSAAVAAPLHDPATVPRRAPPAAMQLPSWLATSGQLSLQETYSAGYRAAEQIMQQQLDARSAELGNLQVMSWFRERENV